MKKKRIEERKKTDKDKSTNKKLFIIFACIVLFVMLFIIIIIILINFRNNNTLNDENNSINDNDNIVKNNCNLLEYYELQKCLENNIDNGINYTKEELINYGFKEINIDNIDLNKKLSLELNSAALQKFDKIENVIFTFSGGGNSTIELKENEITITYYDETNKNVNSKKISNIESMYYYKIKGHTSIHYVYLIDNNNKLLQLKIETYGSYKDVIDNEFEELNTNHKYTEFYSLYQYSTTSGEIRLNLGKDENGKLRFIDNEKIYNEQTYKIVNSSVSIMENRDIYLDDNLQSFKMKLEYDNFALGNEINYILSSENYLYDYNLKLMYDKKVNSILNMSSTVVTIYEDGKNLFLNYTEIKY